MFDTVGMVLSVSTSQLRELADRVKPVVLARENVLSISGPLAAVVPDGSLRRGSTLTIAGSGATSVALELVSGASRAGSWTALVGLHDVAPVAVLEAGLNPERVAFINPGQSARHADVIAALVGAVDLIMVDARLSLRQQEIRRLGARLRECGSVMVVVMPGTDPLTLRCTGEIGSAWTADVALMVEAASWQGPDRGHGHVQSRRISIETLGRGRAAGGRRHVFEFPSGEGTIVSGDPAIDASDAVATVLPFVR